MERYFRDWLHDSLKRHEYESAVFAGDKLYALTKDPEDAFWLAQAFFYAGNYSRAYSFISQLDSFEDDAGYKSLAAHCLIKEEKYVEALELLGDQTPSPAVLRLGSPKKRAAESGRSGSRTRTAGRQPGGADQHGQSPSERETSKIRYEASMCYLRGLCYSKKNDFETAKKCYKAAVLLNPQCYDAFYQLSRASLMTPAEEKEFIGQIDFLSACKVGSAGADRSEAAELMRFLYVAKLSGYDACGESSEVLEQFLKDDKLGENEDVLLAKARSAYEKGKVKTAFELTTRITDRDEFNTDALILRLACLYELKEKNTLFLLSHNLIDNRPSEAVSWLAVGTYYLLIGDISKSRDHFMKAMTLDPFLGPASIGFAHTFAADGEHHQAETAYSSVSAFFTGSYFPQLCLGMQYIQLSSLSLAHQAIQSAYMMCKEDPLVLNELGVVFYYNGQLGDAIWYFGKALEIVRLRDEDASNWVSTQANLAHALRRSGKLDESLEAYELAIQHGGRTTSNFSSKGLVLLELGRLEEAITSIHVALSINPLDTIATPLLEKALALNASDSRHVLPDNSKFERYLERYKRGVSGVR